MGKQLSLYLDEQEAKRLTEIAERECRRPSEQARWLLRQALMGSSIVTETTMQPSTNQEMALAL